MGVDEKRKRSPSRASLDFFFFFFFFGVSPRDASASRLDSEMTNITLSITGLLSTDAHQTALSDA